MKDRLFDRIRKAYTDHMRTYDYEEPKTVTMNKTTKEVLKGEIAPFLEKLVVKNNDKYEIFGMTIVVNDQLPDGIFIVGGIIGTSA